MRKPSREALGAPRALRARRLVALDIATYSWDTTLAVGFNGQDKL